MSAVAPFSFATAGEIHFGRGAASDAPQRVADLGKRAFLVTGSSGERAGKLAEALVETGVDVAQYRVSGEPTVEIALAGVDAARDHGSDVIIGLGGGSVIETGKAIAALLTNPGSPFDYLEVVGKD